MAKDNEVKIPVSLPGAGPAAGDAGKVAEGIRKIGDAAKGASAATAQQAAAAGNAGKELASLGEVSEKGIGIGRAFGDVLRGNWYALGNLTAALKVAGAAMKTSFLGVAVLALTAVANALPAIIEKLKGTSKQAADTGAAFQAVDAAAEALDKVKLEGLKLELEGIKQRSEASREEIERLQAAADKLDDAEMAAQLAENKVAPGLTDEQRSANELAIRRRFANARAEREEAGMRAAETAAATERGSLQDVWAERAAAVTEARETVAAQERRKDENRLRQVTITEELRRMPTWDDAGAAITPEQQKVIDERLRLGRELARLKQEEESLTSEPAQALERRNRATLAAREREFEMADRDVRASATREEQLLQRNYTQRAVNEFVRGARFREDYATQAGAPADLRPESTPTFRRDTLVVDGRTAAADTNAVAQEVERQGQKTGAQLAADMIEAVRKNNEALVRQFRDQLKAMPNR